MENPLKNQNGIIDIYFDFSSYRNVPVSRIMVFHLFLPTCTALFVKQVGLYMKSG